MAETDIFKPLTYQGVTYPSREGYITDGNGVSKDRTYFRDYTGQYYAIDDNGNAVPMHLYHPDGNNGLSIQHTDPFPEESGPVITPSEDMWDTMREIVKNQQQLLADSPYAASKQDIELAKNVYRHDLNQQRQAIMRAAGYDVPDNGIWDDKQQSYWDKLTIKPKEYDTTLIGFSKAMMDKLTDNTTYRDDPLIQDAVQANNPNLLGTAKYYINQGLNSPTGKALTGTWLPIAAASTAPAFPAYLDAGLTSYFGAKGLTDLANGNENWTTALDLFPLGRVGKSVYDAGRGYFDLGRSWFRGKIKLDPTSTTSITDNAATIGQDNYPLRGKTEIPKEIKRNAANDYTTFINSKEYHDRLQNAGLENHWEYMKALTDRQINNIDSFPSKVQSEVAGDAKVLGQADSNPNSPDYGIILREDLGADEIYPALNHELAHFATASAGIDDIKNLKNPNFTIMPNINYIGDIMRYDEGIAPNISWEDDILPKLTKDKSISIGELEEKSKRYNYLTNPQEKRARAYSIYQQAKELGMSTDEFVDKFIKDGKIVDNAPMQLKQMGEILTLDNLKKYLRNFLSIATPVSITKLNNEQ